MEGTERLPAPARVVFADDDAILRELLGGLLGFLPHVTVVGEARDGIEAVRLVAQHYPDTVLLDVDMRAWTASERRKLSEASGRGLA